MIGRTVSHYRITGLLGEGGMGAVYRSEDTKLQRGVPLKLLPDDARALSLGGFALAEIGQRARSLDWAKRALALDPNEPLTLYNVACLYAMLGEVEQGIECLETSVKDGYSHRDWIQNDSTFDPLRRHPRFQKLLAGL